MANIFMKSSWGGDYLMQAARVDGRTGRGPCRVSAMRESCWLFFCMIVGTKLLSIHEPAFTFADLSTSVERN